MKRPGTGKATGSFNKPADQELRYNYIRHDCSWEYRPDAFPADDAGVPRFISQFYLSGRKISAAEARTFAGRWGAWKGFAAYYLEVADMLGIRPAVQRQHLAVTPAPAIGVLSRREPMVI